MAKIRGLAFPFFDKMLRVGRYFFTTFPIFKKVAKMPKIKGVSLFFIRRSGWEPTKS